MQQQHRSRMRSEDAAAAAERLKQLWKCIIDTTSSSSAFGGNLLLSAHFEY